MKNHRIAYVLLPLLILTGCQEEKSSRTSFPSTPPVEVDYKGAKATIDIFRNEGDAEKECYIDPRNVKITQSYQSLSGTLANNQSVCPSIGEVNLLVIPVNLPGNETMPSSQSALSAK